MTVDTPIKKPVRTRALRDFYRPKTLDEIVGHETQVKEMQAIIDSKARPHCILLTGQAGIAKTTSARILARAFGARNDGLIEVDGATKGTKEDIKDLVEMMSAMPFTGSAKVAIIDECFARGTLVNTPLGPVPIEEIREGMEVLGAKGTQRVKRSVKNWVNSSRIVRLTSGDRIIYCSEDHAFLTSEGWVEARSLDGKSVFNQQGIHVQPQLQKMWDGIYEYRRWVKVLRTVLDQSLSELRAALHVSVSPLLSVMCSSDKRFSVERSLSYSGSSSGYLSWNSQRSRESTGIFSGSRSPQFGASQGSQYGFGLSNEGGRITQTEGLDVQREGRQRIGTDGASENTAISGRGNSRTSGGNRNEGEGNTELLPDRSGVSRAEVGGGDRRSVSQFQNSDPAGQDQGSVFSRVRVDRPEIQELRDTLGSDWGSGEGGEGAWFYDLEVEGHPSFSVEGMVVHNCHAINTAAWQAFLKSTEEPPRHAYYIFCTTEEQKVPKTIVEQRATTIRFKEVPASKLFKWAKEVILPQEGKIMDDEVIKKISTACGGSPRKFLNLLEQCLDLTNMEEINDILKVANIDEKDPVVRIAKLLIASSINWSDYQRILPEIEDVGGMRKTLKAYLGKVFMRENSWKKVAVVLEAVDKMPMYPDSVADIELMICRAIHGMSKV